MSITEKLRLVGQEQREIYGLAIDNTGERVLKDDEVEILAIVGLLRAKAWGLKPGDPVRRRALKRMVGLQNTDRYRAAYASYERSFEIE